MQAHRPSLPSTAQAFTAHQNRQTAAAVRQSVNNLRTSTLLAPTATALSRMAAKNAASSPAQLPGSPAGASTYKIDPWGSLAARQSMSSMHPSPALLLMRQSMSSQLSHSRIGLPRRTTKPQPFRLSVDLRPKDVSDR